MRRIILVLLTIPLLGILLAGCGDVSATDAELTTPVDSFMKAVSAGDIESAWQLTSEEGRKTSTKEQFASGIAAEPYSFQGYESLTLETRDVTVNVGGPTIATISGTIKYSDDEQGTFSAALEKEDNGWKISGMQVNASPARIKQFTSGS